MHIHIIGICGTFMGGIAALAKAAGHKVTGCDANVYPPMSDQLEALGITLTEGFAADQVDLQPDLFVIGNVAKRGMPLIEEILNRGLPYTSGPQWLSEHILQGRWVLAVAGTHGKTTTASMLAWILEYAGLAPGFLIGGVPQNFSVSARMPDTPQLDPKSQSPFFVIEADEYDTAFFDKRSKFVHYRPRTAVLNNLEFDHADIFADLGAIETQFHHLVRTIPAEGCLVVNHQADSLQRVLARGYWTPVDYFGSDADWHITMQDDGFEILQKNMPVAAVKWSLMGEHNANNALAAMLAARHVGVSFEVACEALSQFKNVKRRQEIRGVVHNITVYDDFAHHPTAIALTLEGLRHKVGNARIIAVLEPRSNTMKMGAVKEALAGSLTEADQVFCYAHGLEWDVAGSLSSLGEKAHTFTDIDTLVSAISTVAESGDHILVMSNGGFAGVHQRLLDALNQR
jgi:UDP-N-acetylmuramate: L-alanyl-gamma-D-glutamyl-meso-diaminopimelate ligase